MLERYAGNDEEIKKHIMDMFHKIENENDEIQYILIHPKDWIILMDAFKAYEIDPVTIKIGSDSGIFGSLYGAMFKKHYRDEIIFQGKNKEYKCLKKNKYEFINT